MREKITPPSLNHLDMREKITQPHSLLMGKQMRINTLETENLNLKSFIAEIMNSAGKHKSSTSAKQNTSQGSTSNSQSQERPIMAQSMQTPSQSSQASTDRPSNQGQTAGALNHQPVPFVSPSVQPPQPSGPMHPPLVSPNMHTQHRLSHMHSSGYSQLQSRYPSNCQPLRNNNQMQSSQANRPLQSPFFSRPIHTANVSTHPHSNAPHHSQWPSHSGHVQVPPADERRPLGIGTKPYINADRSQNSNIAPALPQSERHYPPNVYQNNQQFNYHPPNPTQNSPASYPWASRPHLEVPNERNRAFQQEQRRKYPYMQPSNVQYNTSTPTQSCMQSHMQQSVSNTSTHRLASTQNQSLLSLTSMSYSQSSHSLQLQSTHYQQSAELYNDFRQIDRLKNPSVPFPSPRYFQQEQQQLSQNTPVHANQSHGQMLAVERGFGAGTPLQGNFNTPATNSTQLSLPSTSSQPVNTMHFKNECLQSKAISSVTKENNDNMRLDDFLSELHSEVEKQLCENMSNSIQNSISVSEIIEETENYISNPTKLQMSTDIHKKENSHCSKSERVLFPSTVSSMSNKSIRYFPPSSLTPPLTPPEKCLIRSEVASNCHEIGTTDNHKEKENPLVDEDTLPLNNATDKYLAKTFVTEPAESFQSSNATQSTEPVSETSFVFTKKCMSTRNYGDDEASLSQSNLLCQNDSIKSPSEAIAVKPKTSLYSSVPQGAVPGSMASSHQSVPSERCTKYVSNPSELTFSQNALLSSSFVDRPGVITQMPILSPTVMHTSNNVESSCLISSESEKIQQHEISNKSACFISNSIASGKVLPVVHSQPNMSQAEFLKNRGVTENLSAGQTRNKAQTNYNIKIVSEELLVPSNSLYPVYLVNDNPRKINSELEQHPKDNTRELIYAPITVAKTVQLTEESKVFCYVCRKDVNVKDIFKHLLFGYIKCSRCDSKIKRCIDLEGMKMEKLICNKRKLMIHEFNVWALNPVDYLSYHMWSKSKESPKASPEKQVEGLSRYLQTLSCLESVEPWSTAFMRCKKYTNNMLRDSKLDKEMNSLKIAKRNLENADNLQTSYRTEEISISTESDEGIIETIDKPEKAIMTNEEDNGCLEIVSLSSRQVIDCDENVECLGSGANENELKNYEVSKDDYVTASIENCDTEMNTSYDNPSDCHHTESASNSFASDCLLETFYTMDHLLNTTEYVAVDDACAELQKKGSDIPENNHCSSELCNPCNNGDDETTLQLKNSDFSDSTDLEDKPNEARNDLNMDERGLIIDIDTVELSKYKQTQPILEECPMCYEVLCPSMFTVNAQSFTISTVCAECGLIISLRPKDSSKENLTGAHDQEHKRPGPKIKTKNSRIKRPKVIIA